MAVLKLGPSHVDAVQQLFGKSPDTSTGDFNVNLLDFSCESFCDVYLAGRESFHAYGYIDENGTLTSLISFYESDEEPSWYYTFGFTDPDNDHLNEVLDAAINDNETTGRLKFYTKIHSRSRGSQWSDNNNTRYSFFDEYVIPSHGICFYDHHSLALFFDKMIPGELIVRCNFLKQEYREVLPLGGNL